MQTHTHLHQKDQKVSQVGRDGNHREVDLVNGSSLHDLLRQRHSSGPDLMADLGDGRHPPRVVVSPHERCDDVTDAVDALWGVGYGYYAGR